MFTADSSVFQGWLYDRLASRDGSVIKLHGGGDAVLPVRSMGNDGFEEARIGVLATHSENWLPIATELIGAASVVVVLTSDLSEGLRREVDLLRSCGQQHRCLVVLQDPRRTFGAAKGDPEAIRAHFADFPHVFVKPETAGNVPRFDDWEGHAVLRRLIEQPRTRTELEHSLHAGFGYLEPELFRSDTCREWETILWNDLHIMRVTFNDGYWVNTFREAAMTKGPLAMTIEGVRLHRLHGIALAFGDFKAVVESALCLAKLYHIRHSLYGFNLNDLAAQYHALRNDMDEDYRIDTESKFGAKTNDVLGVSPKTRQLVHDLMVQASSLASARQPADACVVFQSAFVCVRESSDQDELERQQYSSDILVQWAKLQSDSGVLDWACLNYRLDLAISEKLAAEDPDRFQQNVSRALSNLGAVYFRMGDLTVSEAMMTRALAMRRAGPRDDPVSLFGLGTSLMNLGNLRWQMNDRPGARALLEEGISVWQHRANLNENGIIELTRHQVRVSRLLAQPDGDKAAARALAQEALANLAVLRQRYPEAAAVEERDLASVLAALET
jgi:tetratricopeptide (TPR) repeat protein